MYIIEIHTSFDDQPVIVSCSAAEASKLATQLQRRTQAPICLKSEDQFLWAFADRVDKFTVTKRSDSIAASYAWSLRPEEELLPI